MTPFAINPALDPKRLAERFAASGRIQISDFLAADGAARLREALSVSMAWKHLIHGDSKVFEIARTAFDALPPTERAAIDEAVFASARCGFQFRYDSIRVPDAAAARARSGTLLDGFAEFMSSPLVLALLARVTARSDIAFAYAQATRYQAGDFLTGHDDDVAGKRRRLAYVLGLTAGWRPEFGGLLLFGDAEEGIAQTIVPRFNALSLFAVPQPHSVSYVAPYASEPRLSVTGWLRAGPRDS